MKPVLPYSFQLMIGFVYLLLFLSVVAFGFQIRSWWLPLQYRSQNIELNIPLKTGNNTIVVGYFQNRHMAKQPEGKITLSSKTGRSYQGYYYPKLWKIRVDIPSDFGGNLQIVLRLLYLVASITAVVILYIISEVLASLEKGSPFTVKNARYMGMVSTICFCLLIFSFLVNLVWESFVEFEFNIVFNSSINPSFVNALLFISIMAVFSYVLKQGVRMKEEQDLTI
jgi:hypothetical protein